MIFRFLLISGLVLTCSAEDVSILSHILADTISEADKNVSDATNLNSRGALMLYANVAGRAGTTHEVRFDENF
jgi:hypothetical protein